jgi:hypothetical protein
MLKKKICANFLRIIDFTQKKLSLSSQKYGFGIRDPGSGKNLPLIQGPIKHRIRYTDSKDLEPGT